MISRYITFIFFLQLFLGLSTSVKCQERDKELIIEYSDATPNKDWIEKINNTHYQDSLELLKSLNSLRAKYNSNGYISAGFEILYSDSSELKVKFSSGIKYEWGLINPPLNHPPEIPKVSKTKKVKSGKIITVNQIDDIRRSFLEVYENNGYPFASVRYDSITIIDGVINTNLVVEPGPLVFFDSIVNRSEDRAKCQMSFLELGMPSALARIQHYLSTVDRTPKNPDVKTVLFFQAMVIVLIIPRMNRNKPIMGMARYLS